MTDCKQCISKEVCGLYEVAQQDPAGSAALGLTDNCNQFRDRRRFIELPFGIGDIVFSITQRSDTKKFCVRRATITVKNAMHYRKIYYENLLYLTRSDADSMVHELNALKDII